MLIQREDHQIKSPDSGPTPAIDTYPRPGNNHRITYAFSFTASNTPAMKSDRYPVILVHGWNVAPASGRDWLFVLRQQASLQKFHHAGMQGSAFPEIAASLDNDLREVRHESGWSGPVDIVCHSIGTCLVRYLLEVVDGTDRSQTVRQLIGLGPPNNGSALAELFNDPTHGEKIINRLTGVFVPRGYNPAADRSYRTFGPEVR